MEQTASTSFNIHDNKENVEQMSKQSLNAFRLIQHRFNFDSTSFNTVSRGRGTRFQQNGMDVEAVCSGLYIKTIFSIFRFFGIFLARIWS